ncbi:MAG: MATE family efflux transporter [Janthinobacterium lividum]
MAEGKNINRLQHVVSPALKAGGRAAFRSELLASVRLGGPLALGELGWMSTYIVDAIMVGHLPHSALSISASSLGNTIYYAIAFFAIYLLNGLETFIAQAAGQGNRSEAVRMLMQSMWIVGVGTPVVMVATLASALLLPHLGTSAEMFAETQRYLHALVWSTAPLMLYMAIRRFLQSINRVLLVSASLITAGLVNWFFDWCLLYGHFHFPALGIAGSGWSTVLVRCWMLVVIVPGAVLAFRELDVWPEVRMLIPDAVRLKALLRIGWPSGLQFSLELGISTYMSVLCARLGTTYLAAHQVTLDLNAFVYMVPTGLAYAAMIRVGQAAGRNSLDEVRRSASASLTLALGYSSFAAVLFLVFSQRFAHLYTTDPHVVAAAVPLFRLCALLILGDAAFVIHASALTGLGDTRSPMWISITCNWVLGMPAAYLLAFPLGQGVYGLWVGRAMSSVVSGVAMSAWWYYRMRVEKSASSSANINLLTPLRAR